MKGHLAVDAVIDRQAQFPRGAQSQEHSLRWEGPGPGKGTPEEVIPELRSEGGAEAGKSPRGGNSWLTGRANGPTRIFEGLGPRAVVGREDSRKLYQEDKRLCKSLTIPCKDINHGKMWMLIPSL